MFNARYRRFATWALLAAIPVLVPPAALADEANVYSTAIVRSANTALQDALRSEHVAQALPVGEEKKPLSSPGLPVGLTYTLDVSMARALGNTGYNNAGALPGGWDAVVGYGFNKNFRLQAGYYTFQEYPLGFDTGIVPVYANGAKIGSQDLNQLQYNATVNNKIIVLQAQNLITIARRFPIVITPTYLVRNGTIGGGSDLLPIQVNSPTTGYAAIVHYRTVQEYLIAVTIPILSSPRFFASITAAPQWNVKNTGIQTTNSAQIFELAYLEYRATPGVTLFVQPSRLVNNLPTDQTPQFIPTFIYGFNAKLAKQLFAQVAFSTGTPSNRSTLGIQSITIAPPGIQAPTLAGLKATQVQVQFGFGSPSVIPL